VIRAGVLVPVPTQSLPIGRLDDRQMPHWRWRHERSSDGHSDTFRYWDTIEYPHVQALPMPRLTRAESQARTRPHLLDAAADVFARVGFHAAGIEEIAGDASDTKGAGYSNFTRKAELYRRGPEPVLLT